MWTGMDIFFLSVIAQAAVPRCHLGRENIRQSHENARLPGAHCVTAILAQAAARTLTIAGLPQLLAPSADCPTGGFGTLRLHPKEDA
jgi:hypothetical protein